jgi:hypothetical protein
MEWTDGEIQTRLHRAQARYLADLKTWKSEGTKEMPDPGLFPNWKVAAEDPKRTVAETLAAFNEQKEAYRLWEAKRIQTTRPFAYRLEEEGFESPYKVEGADWQLVLSWGHQHGLGGLDYGEEEKDLQSGVAIEF